MPGILPRLSFTWVKNAAILNPDNTMRFVIRSHNCPCMRLIRVVISVFPVFSKSVQEHLLSTLITQSGPWPYLIVFGVLLLCGFGVPMPEDVVLFAAGLIAYYGSADVGIMIAVCFAGVMIGDSTIFFIGNFFGPKIRERPFVQKLLTPERMELVQKKMHKQGNKVIFAARFMPGLRTPIFFTAGTLHLPYRIFLLYDGFAALISVPTIVFAVYYFGENVDKVIKVVKKIQFGVILTIISIVIIVAIKYWWSHKKEKELVE